MFEDLLISLLWISGIIRKLCKNNNILENKASFKIA